MVILDLARYSVGGINYLFLRHVVGDRNIVNNDTVENELYTFFSLFRSTMQKLKKPDVAFISNFVSQEIATELCEGDYFHEFSPPILKERVFESIYIILGYDCPIIGNLYENSIDRGYILFNENNKKELHV